MKKYCRSVMEYSDVHDCSVANIIKKTTCILNLCLCIFFSCSETPKQASNNRIIDFESAYVNKQFSIQKLSDYADKIRYLPLETTDSGLIYNLNYEKCHYQNNRFYLANFRKLLFFDSSGKFIKQVGQEGQGPKEYLSITTVDVQPENKNIYIQNKNISVLEFDENGNFSRSVRLNSDSLKNSSPISFCTITPNLYFFDLAAYGNEYYKFAFSDSIYKQLQLIEYDTPLIKSSGYGPGTYMRRVNNEIHVKKQDSDTLYIVKENKSIETGYVFDMGKYSSRIESNRDNHTAIEFTNSPLRESARFLFINTNFGSLSPEPIDAIANRPEIGIFNRPYVDTRVNCIYDKEQGRLHLLKQPIPKTLGLLNDIDKGFVFWPDIISSDGKEMVMFYEADKFLEDYAKLENPSDEITKVAKSLVEDDNPVAIIATFKK